MANSADVVAGDDILASQYNNLRDDTLDASTGHQHLGGADEGKKILGRSIDPETKQSSTSEAIAADDTWTPGVGVYMINTVGSDSVLLEIYIGGAWRQTAEEFSGGMLWCDGSTVRLKNPNVVSAVTVYYHKF